MANDNEPRGLFPLNVGNKGTVTAHYYQVDTAVDLFHGMPVTLGSDGLVLPAHVGTAGYVPLLGAIIGFTMGNSGGTNRGSELPFTPSTAADPFLDVSDLAGGGKTAYALVADDPQQEFVVQLDSGGSLAQNGFGAITRLLYRSASSGNATTGWANLEVDQSITVQTTAGNLLLVRPHDSINTDGTFNQILEDFGKVVVQIAVHQKNPHLRAGAIGI